MKKTIITTALETIAALETSTAAAVVRVSSFGKTYTARAAVAYGLAARASRAATAARAAVAVYDGKKTKANRATMETAAVAAVVAEKTLSAYVAGKHVFAEISATCREKAAAAIANNRGKSDFAWKPADGTAAAVVMDRINDESRATVAEIRAAHDETATRINNGIEKALAALHFDGKAAAARIDTVLSALAVETRDDETRAERFRDFYFNSVADGEPIVMDKKTGLQWNRCNRNLGDRVAAYMRNIAHAATVARVYDNELAAAATVRAKCITVGDETRTAAVDVEIETLRTAKTAAMRGAVCFRYSKADKDAYELFQKFGAERGLDYIVKYYGRADITATKWFKACAAELSARTGASRAAVAASGNTEYLSARSKSDFLSTCYSMLADDMLAKGALRRCYIDDVTRDYYRAKLNK